ncbi:hypothetical protein WN71_013170 [Streptomyces mangrovisoli]|uniref:Uncharacterized protein n=1 Tax=Streptomyces mangrovisoli TaxID=1428628 RepID=A0A1J4NYK9_9ACTN|nr:hypothetical protein WN71_013170 [Streptomyces mangrovisoli]
MPLWSQGPGPVQPWAGQGGPPAAPSMLASHADRERAVDVLRAGYGEGRLEQPEFEKRVARAYAARTVGELAHIVADLPQGPVPVTVPLAVVPGTFRPQPVPTTNGKAVGAFVCGLLCVPTGGLTAIPAVVLGHTARSEIRHGAEAGDGLAVTGLVLGWMAIGFWALLLVLALMAAVFAG